MKERRKKERKTGNGSELFSLSCLEAAKDKIKQLSYGANEHQFVHCLKIMRPRCYGVWWVINVTNYQEFPVETG